jgi:hypothetical protein
MMHDAAESQILLQYIAAKSQTSPLQNASGNQVNDFCRNLPAAWCRDKSPHCIYSRELQ